VSEFDFLNPDYRPLFEERARRIRKMRNEPEIIAGLLEYYKTNPVAFINDWGITFDPRNAERGLPSVIPFKMFPKQEEFIDWAVAKWRGSNDGLVEKSRDMGISWLCVAIAVWMWLFHSGTVIGFGSRKEEYVDKLGDPKSLFWKMRQFIAFLPKEFRPVGWDERKYAPHMRIINPANGSTIVGEAGDNIGRGNRTSVYFKDESAFYERAESVDAALSQTSNCKLDVSTPNGNGNPFFRKRHSGKVDVFTFHWKDDPRKDEEWYRKQCDLLDPVIVAQEIDIDYSASVSDVWISADLVMEAQRNKPADVDALGKWVIGVDAAHMGDDESVIHLRKGRLNLPQVIRRQADGSQLAGAVIEQIDNLGPEAVAYVIIELDGPGTSCYDHLKQSKYGSKIMGVHTGARLSDDRNYNVRAKMWRDAKQYLEDKPVCLYDDSELRVQLASVKYKYKDGLLLMQSKKDYKGLIHKSPDRADAFVLTFAAQAKPVSLRDIYGL
jgi:phage terminase large subunit